MNYYPLDNPDTRNDVFVINDVDLIVPPTQITINQEDLLYTWKTLRTRASTKVATGLGQIRIHVSIPFTNAMILDLHRLIVEFRQSPFCYIKNQFIRESIVPDWPIYQQMACTLSSMEVMPIPGSSDSWMCEMDFVWFNYLPYMHNYLFREDWNTNWIILDNDLEQKDKVKLSIGWDLDKEDYTRKPRMSIVEIESNSEEGGTQHPSWDSIKDGYSSADRRTIFDMELLHFGESFDVLPLPGNMEPQDFVSDARNSRIYTRFINYLQRDALIKNFGFDPEEDLGDLAGGYFSAVTTDAGPMTYSLHAGPVPSHIKGSWISQMIQHNSAISFNYHVFTNIQLPKEWTNEVRKTKESLFSAVVPEQATLQGTTKFLQAKYATGKNRGPAVEVRNGWWNPVGKSVPFSESRNSTVPANINYAISKVTDPLKIRDRSKLYKRDSVAAASMSGLTLHSGTDFGLEVGTHVFAVEPGIVTVARRGDVGGGVVWYWVDTGVSGATRRGKVTESSEILQDWQDSLSRNGEIEIKISPNRGNYGPQVEPAELQSFGTFVPSVTQSNIWYYANYTSAGQQIRIRHDNGSESVYMHLDTVNVSPGDRIETTTQSIGTVGQTSTLSNAYLDAIFQYRYANPSAFDNNANSKYNHVVNLKPEDFKLPDDAMKGESAYTLGAHLHFEYYETRDIPNTTPTTTTKIAPVDEGAGLVLVDPLVSWRAAKDQNRPDIIAVTYASQIDENTSEVTDKAGDKIPGLDALRQLLKTLNEDGWVYYEDDASITNIWHKPINLTVRNSNGTGPAAPNDTTILANATGGLRHIIANIPILSHEYPTQQHLGSIEPTYQIQFTLKDDSQDLAGISEQGKLLQNMRHLLQKNARDFRPIADAWCVATDTFITRLFGTYEVKDIVPEKISTLGFEGNSGLNTVKLKKRTSIMNSAAGTMPGAPGMSSLSFEIQETNPLDLEKLQPKSLNRLDLDEARKKVLNTLYSLDFLDDNPQFLALLLAKETNNDVMNPDSELYGQFNLQEISASPSTSQLKSLPSVFVQKDYNGTGTDALLVRDETGVYGEIFRRVAENYGDDRHTFYGQSKNLSGFAEIPIDLLTLGVDYTVEDKVIYSERENDFSQKTEVSIPTRHYQLDAWADEYSVNEINMNVIKDYFYIINDTLRFGERMIAEHSSKGDNIIYTEASAQYLGKENGAAEGLLDSTISEELFGLPFDAQMWRSWQYYMVTEAAIQKGNSAVVEMTNNPTWLNWKSGLDVDTTNDVSRAAYSSRWNQFIFPTLGSFPAGFSSDSLKDVSIASFAYQDAVESEMRESNRTLLGRYLTSFPLDRELDTVLESYSYNKIFGVVLGLDKEKVQPRAFEQWQDDLLTNIVSGGYFVPNITLQTPEFKSKKSSDIFVPTEISPEGIVLKGAFIPGPENVPTNGELAKAYSGYAAGTVRGRRTMNRLAARYDDAEPKFTWIVNQGVEIQKVEYFKKILASVADKILQDPEALEILKLTELADLTRRGNLVGSDAYPDMVLPFHPFFGDTLSVDPDFFMWNIYDDGQALSHDIQLQVKKELDGVIDRCYNSLKQKEAGQELSPNISKDKRIVIEGGVDGIDQLKVQLKFAAEGTDIGEWGPASSTFYPVELAEDGARGFLEALNLSNHDSAKIASSIYNASVAGAVSALAFVSSEKLANQKTSVRVSNAEGYVNGNVAGGVQYPRRLNDVDYEKLKNQVDSIERMFGTKLGYQDENILSDNSKLSDRLTQSKLGRSDDFAHTFDPESLKKLALDSSKDIVSQRLTLKRAFPTFKLFFVEEDEFENRTLSFDDFFSYNAVQSFYVEMSRKSPADTAILTVQNVSGVLDGTKRDAVVDLDFFSKAPQKLLEEGQSSISGDVLNKETSDDQPFGAIVLRPGLNVQLRCGYSNDPDNLHVMVSGRIVDIQWNKNGDLAELLVQSFGTELVQALKGTQRQGDSTIYYTTHELLGSLMLEPELTHFGRWEIGQLYQIGESSDYRLDFKDYSQEGYLGRFNLTRQILQWASDHPTTAATTFFTTAGLAGVATASVAAFEGTGLGSKIIDQTLGRVKRFFTAKQVSLFVSPQDDNLYPPHPKDYMTINQSFVDEVTDWVVGQVGASVGEDSVLGKVRANAYRWWKADRFTFEKKVSPLAARYTLLSSTTWKVFHEMSLRHPGWIYGARPYGNEFRYTMFFGVPSQRYWSRGESNQFIKRVNDLYGFLHDSDNFSNEKLELEYRKLYGDYVDGTSLRDMKVLAQDAALTALEQRNIPIASNNDYNEFLFNNLSVTPIPLPVDAVYRDTKVPSRRRGPSSKLEEQQVVIDMESTTEYQAQLRQALSGPALKEYLRALNLRFVPFRRYHLITSERNLVWNGLISAENAVTNAVDVTYFSEVNTANTAEAPVGSTLFKAHSFIPEHQLRIAPVRWSNCRGYVMAMRYGMGELVHRMKDMYRGEIIVMGNARMRPWDIGILVDSYNDMVGPIEIDSLVHSFSHETGFITEIKPSAVVIGNEISSWPMIEAMKTFSLAVLDIETNYLNLNGSANEDSNTDAGIIRDFANMLNGWNSDDMAKLIKSRHKEILSEENASNPITLGTAVFGGSEPEPNIPLVNTGIYNAEKASRTLVKELINNNLGILQNVPLHVYTNTTPHTLPADLASNVFSEERPTIGETISNKIDFPGLAWLIGGPLLFLQCLREDSIIVVPLIKNGAPIVSGLSYHDPTMIWNNFRGDLRQFIDDVMDGTRDMISEYKEFGTHIWNKTSIEDLRQLGWNRDTFGEKADLTNRPGGR